MLSSVVASVQFEVTAISLALTVIQVPAPTAKAPEVVVNPPPSRALKEPEAKLIFPPVIVSPEADESPPMEATLNPPARVEVAVEEELNPPINLANPLTFKVEPTVEEPVERRLVVVAKPTFVNPNSVEEAVERNPEANLISVEVAEVPETTCVKAS